MYAAFIYNTSQGRTALIELTKEQENGIGIKYEGNQKSSGIKVDIGGRTLKTITRNNLPYFVGNRLFLALQGLDQVTHLLKRNVGFICPDQWCVCDNREASSLLFVTA